jgi:drug/metabolite transporter (DMT)-like permease|nr:EamA family transporter [Nitrosomonas nitrosa]
MSTFAIAIISIMLSVAAQFCLKTGLSSDEIKEILTHPFTFHTLFKVLLDKYVLAGFFLYGLGAVVWLEVLSKWDVSKAYPLVGLGFVFTVIIGFLIGEEVTVSRAIGVILICAGVLMVGRS